MKHQFLEQVYEVLAGNTDNLTQDAFVRAVSNIKIDYDAGHIDIVLNGRECFKITAQPLPRFELMPLRDGCKSIYDHATREEVFLQGEDADNLPDNASQSHLAEYFN